MDKVKEFDKLILQMSKCDKCLNMKSRNSIDCSLINIYKDKEFSKHRCESEENFINFFYNFFYCNHFLLYYFISFLIFLKSHV